MSLYHPGITTISIADVSADEVVVADDEVSVEEPLEIVVNLTNGGQSVRRSLAVTMRTPGADIELAAGFLLTEGVVRDRGDVIDVRIEHDGRVCITIAPEAEIDFDRLERHSYVSSSCGVCGKRSIAAVFAIRRYDSRLGVPHIHSEIIHGLGATQRAAQPSFARTGGLHAAALFDAEGQLLSLREDVGRHNALDKLIGAEFLAGRLPLDERILFLSGRASFELIQKAALAGIPFVAAVGAPSSLAVSLARQCSMTLLGFVRDGRFNVYADDGRLAETPTGLFTIP
ncbi:MAG: formate dehydrogenase accessory sulfurtransferase FdhD [Pirellulales bacterium]